MNSWKKDMRFEPATSCILRKHSTTWAISDITIYHFNVIDKQVNVYSSMTNFLKLNLALNPLVNRHLSFVSKS